MHATIIRQRDTHAEQRAYPRTSTIASSHPTCLHRELGDPPNRVPPVGSNGFLPQGLAQTNSLASGAFLWLLLRVISHHKQSRPLTALPVLRAIQYLAFRVSMSCLLNTIPANTTEYFGIHDKNLLQKARLLSRMPDSPNTQQLPPSRTTGIAWRKNVRFARCIQEAPDVSDINIIKYT